MKKFVFDESPVILKDFLNYMETIRGKSKNTIKEYFYDLRVFFRFLKVYRNIIEPKTIAFEEITITDVDIDLLKTVTLSDLYAFMSFMSRERDNSASSRARKVASIKSFFNYITNKAKLLKTNPASELETPKTQKRLPKYLTVDESMKLLSVISGKHSIRDFAIIILFLNCGMRLSELVGINISNIKSDTLTIIGKGNKERTVYLNDACREAIDNYLKVRPRDGVKDRNALFLSERKQRISNNMVQRIIKKYIIEAGLDPQKYSTHKLRHTAATLMYKHGKVDIRVLQEILGHESIATTELYTHLDNEQLRDAVNSNPLSDYKSVKSDKY
ncbi:tyrosine recombinase XerC [Petroclostridium sp. X23]|uniref:tyrosine recombinase XerC n=1 Tax=Petroclostridium sp. X23 TaxID=3045146 RepID=UPI0024AD393C|nr:tyrosine recombinase XerC [Petroclostridium sp. X23]WHH59527.1 tyrosine recombinase XerC [Petroclostridium sp. X23]